MADEFNPEPQVYLATTVPKFPNYFVINGVVTAELFLITKSFWAIVTALVLHAAGYFMCLREPRFLDLWIQKVSRCRKP